MQRKNQRPKRPESQLAKKEKNHAEKKYITSIFHNKFHLYVCKFFIKKIYGVFFREKEGGKVNFKCVISLKFQ